MNVFKNVKLFAGRLNSFRWVQVKFSSQEDSQPVALRPRKAKAEDPAQENFTDSCHIQTIGGKGGDGCISFMQIWSNDKAGPDGGDGGNGGHVVFKATSSVRDLKHLKHVIKASDGERGFNKDCSGKNANHEFVKVPLGTIVRNSNGVVVGDLSKEGSMFVAARGGAGGHGNHFFASDTIQTPQVAEFGAQGECSKYFLEVKSIAHIGLVGMPNVGKSTLLRAVTRARPRVAGYAFTTLKPHIGIVHYSDYEQVAVADLPGLVEGSHRNEGLGIEFLKHAERCRGIVFVIDLSRDNPIWQYQTLRYEISQFSEEINQRPYAIVGNKMDLPEAVKNLPKFESELGEDVITISAKTGKNLSSVLTRIREIFDLDPNNNDEKEGR